MKKGFYICASFIIAFLMLTLIGCSTSNTVIDEPLPSSTEPSTQLKTPTPEDQMALVKSRLDDEMRIFDVQLHHNDLYAEISSIDAGLTEDEIKVTISEIVTGYMDAYFLEKTREILSEYNEDYTLSDVETLFESTSRTSLYELIELYEWSFYKKNR